jgi:ribonuclease D
MNRTPLNESEVDALLHRELRAPQPPAGWRERVLAATLHAEPPRNAAARQQALELSRLRAEQVIARERNSLRRRVLQHALIGAAALAVLPTLVDRLSPVFGAYPKLGLDGLSLAIAGVALCCGLVAGFPRQMRLLIGL